MEQRPKRKLKTRDDLLQFMREHQACRSSQDYVSEFSKDTPAKEIWEQCTRYSDWQFWLGLRWNPVVATAYLGKIIERVTWTHRGVSVSTRKRELLYEAREDYTTALYAHHQYTVQAYGMHAFSSSFSAALDVGKERRQRRVELANMW